MRIFTSFIVVAISMVLSLAADAQAHECERSCSSRCQDVVDEFQRIIDENRAYCGDATPECVPRCEARYTDGSCRTYGADYCGREPVCVPSCTSRHVDGSCRTYGVDHCGEGRQACVPRCLARHLDGSCRTYGRDVCGRNAYCVVSCVSRHPDGTCREYGADQCGT